MTTKMTRRQFIKSSVATTAGLVVLTRAGGSLLLSANERLNIAVIGCGGRGAENLREVAKEDNIVALCDVDERHAAKSFKQYPGAKKYRDFRRMFDEMEKEIDAVVVATPDHTHAPAGVMAMKLKKHLYCEKPLTHSVHEARVMANIARKNKLCTQLGTQIHAGDNYRRVVELVESGAIGRVGEVHVWHPSNYSGGDRPKERPPVPKTLDWNLWLGPAPYRPYHPSYVPFAWRGWWDFANGGLGDFFCHYVDVVFWTLKLRYPTMVEAEGPPVHPESCPLWIIARYEFPARKNLPPVKFTWYGGDKKPPLLTEANLPKWGAGVLFVGEKGMLMADYNQRKLFPEEKFADFTPPPKTIPDSLGHHKEWLVGCKTGKPTTCNFSYSGPLTEAALLANVSYRSGEKLHWNARRLQAVNTAKAARYVRREYRKGWTL
ncbi:Gfo/Idh/MocA family oxidoreductase [bacterium]|nr:Gfo/Idh/MocA family oxidoreductase [bacterium]